MPFKELRRRLDEADAVRRQLVGDESIEYLLLSGNDSGEIDLDTRKRIAEKFARWWLYARVYILNHRPKIEIWFTCRGTRRIEDWDELTSEQLVELAKIRREIERWEDGEIAELPHPETWKDVRRV